MLIFKIVSTVLDMKRIDSVDTVSTYSTYRATQIRRSV